MLRIQVEPFDATPNGKGWRARATLSGRGVSANAGGWVYASNQRMAIKKLRTKLKNELKIITAAHYRVAACFQMVEDLK